MENGKKEKNIELFNIRSGEITSSLSLNFFMTIIVTFFLGTIITKYNHHEVVQRIPIIFMIISIMGFAYSTLIYVNSSDRYANLKSNDFKRYIVYGNIISEYFGVYFILTATPMAMEMITEDRVIGIFVSIVCCIGLAFYQYLEFSVLQRYIQRIAFRCISGALIMYLCLMYYLFTSKYIILLYVICAMFVIQMFILTIISIYKWSILGINE